MDVDRRQWFQPRRVEATLKNLVCLFVLFIFVHAEAAQIQWDVHDPVDGVDGGKWKDSNVSDSEIPNESSAIDYCVELHAGNNLISFYALPEDASISNVMTSLIGNATEVIGESVAAKYIDGVGWTGSLKTISPISGYWVKVNEVDSLCLADAMPTDSDTKYELHAGSNLVSFPYQGRVSIGDALPDDIESSLTEIIGEGVAASNIEGHGWSGSLTAFEGGKGYWITATDPVVLVYGIPEPSSFLLLGIGLAVVLGRRSQHPQHKGFSVVRPAIISIG